VCFFFFFSAQAEIRKCIFAPHPPHTTPPAMSSNVLDNILRELYSAGSLNGGRTTPAQRCRTLDDLEGHFPVLRSSVWHSASACLDAFRLPSKSVRRLVEELCYGVQLLGVVGVTVPAPLAASLREWVWVVAGFVGRLSSGASGVGGGVSGQDAIGDAHGGAASTVALPAAVHFGEVM
jgi:hypothetical protein